MTKWLFTSFLLLIFATSCSSPHQESKSNPSLVGYELIDQGRAEEAIEHFRALLEKDPGSAEYRRGLSSAYALKGGFRIQSLVKAMKEIREVEHFKGEFEEVFNRTMASNPSLKPFANLIGFQIQLVVFLNKVAALPNITSQQALDLKSSLSVLRSLKIILPGDYLYMAILETLILKQNLLTPVEGVTCDDFIANMQSRIRSSANQYGKILFFLTQSQPSQTLNYERQQAQLAHLTEETSSLTRASLLTLSFMNNASETNPQIRLFFQPLRCEP